MPAKELTNSPTRATAQQHNQNGTSARGITIDGTYDPNACAGCDEQLKEGQALIALDRQWHISCFRWEKSIQYHQYINNNITLYKM